MPYDPVQRHLAIEKVVTRLTSEGQEKRYYRIRSGRWYGGTVTADCVGCGLFCRFCWVSDTVMLHPTEAGTFYTASKVADSMMHLAKKCNLDLMRISGGEPTIGKPHLLQVLDVLKDKGYRFILETNGILIAHDESYVADLSKYRFLHARVSLKGCNEEEFAILTGAKPGGFKLQLRALERLAEAKISCHPSVMTSFSPRKNLQTLTERLGQISSDLAEQLEIEELILYSNVIKKLNAYNLRYYRAYTPDKVPPQQI